MSIFGEMQTFEPNMPWEKVSSRKMNAISRACRAIANLRFGTGIQGRVTPDGVTIGLSPQAERRAIAGGVEIAKFWITPDSILNPGTQAYDLVDAYKDDDGSPATERTWVAKPWLLRRTPFDGKTFGEIAYNYITVERRQAQRLSDFKVIVQNVTPPFWFYRSQGNGEPFYAVKIPGGTGHAVNGVKVVWQALNTGRYWAVER